MLISDFQVLQCAQCQFSRPSIKQEPKYIPICVCKLVHIFKYKVSQHSHLFVLFFLPKVDRPLELLGMDLVGKVTKTDKGNEYICVIVDYYTKWSEAYPIPNKSAAVVARCIINFFYRFGAPKRILTDQGREFVNQVCNLSNYIQKIRINVLCKSELYKPYIRFANRSTKTSVTSSVWNEASVPHTIHKLTALWKN